MTPDANTLARRPGPVGYLLLAPLILWLLLFVIAPTAIMILYSFGRTGELGETVFNAPDRTGVALTWKNYLAIASPEQWAALAFSALAAVACALAVKRLTRRPSLATPIGILVGWFFLCAYTFAWTLAGFHLTPLPFDPSAPTNLKVFVVSVNYAAISTAVCVAAGYPVAFFIGKAPPRYRNGLLMCVMIPFWTSFLVRTYAWVTIFRDNGLLNTSLKAAGVDHVQTLLNKLLIASHVISQPLEWFPFDLYPSTTAVMVGLIYTYLPFMILPIYTSIERLDNAMIEAAFDLGASPLRAFSNVVFPLTRPGVVAGILLVFVPAVGQFAINHILGGGQDVLIGDLIERQFGPGRNPPLGAALGMLLLMVFVITYFLTTRRAATTTH